MSDRMGTFVFSFNPVRRRRSGDGTADWSALHGGASLSYRSPAAMEGRGMANDGEVAGSAAVDAVRGFLGGPHRDGEDWSFEFGEHLESNWGAVYGGALAAGMPPSPVRWRRIDLPGRCISRSCDQYLVAPRS